ncbi:GntR family transcriptional regulator [Lactobacillus delbrueckii]|jgi:GntR family transcriptional regulator|uniref:GntR family transcriptional regulator n=1 Tax=Lactobacillus delbrueckii TaxID=1584 RepID=A0ABD4W3P1_9LACO|nr:GntR family transcriptional regulator [Lactobacillus delbrueckii]MBN6090905.1 GntR family transcriptional regulator [Lactobacillus delbrueckii subsp. bulgaricus]MDA3778287.1 GntR family transcriptional regulator [Lactobacillus delbrueckii]MDA3783218.1 GntR family transcriptional regulator [Lactobacillus delbrueckii]MDA3795211.1 GntR family transcriptional regulator [Lactobacillus delbrueckii]MDA3842434.1 GntR family transcriptional regulator [Lactobacillus delbrueckii]
MARIVLYQEIADKLKKAILQGEYPVGSLIPTENELMDIYGVSKITVRNAVKTLENEGYLEKKSGYGTTVLSNRLFNKLSKVESYSTILEDHGFRLKKKVLQIERVPRESVPVKFEINRLTEVITKVDKLYLLNGQPFIYFQHYFPFPLDIRSKHTIEDTSLYQIVKSTGEVIDRFEDQFIGYVLTAEDKKILGSDSNVGIKRIRRAYNERNELIEYSESVYLTDKYPYEINYSL